MTNWCANTLHITGHAKAVAKFKRQAVALEADDEGKVSLLSFNSFLPVPESIEDIRAIGYDSWHAWYHFNWGTTKEAVLIDLKDISDTEVAYAFETAWDPPEAWITHVATRYPDLQIFMQYAEDGQNYKGFVEFENGRLIDGECVPYYSEELIAEILMNEPEDGRAMPVRQSSSSNVVAFPVRPRRAGP